MPHDPYAALRVKPYRWFIVSLLTMTISTQIQGVVVAWQIYDITKDPLSLGLMAWPRRFRSSCARCMRGTSRIA